MQTICNLMRRIRFLTVLAIVTCGAPSQAWCGSQSLWVSYYEVSGIASFTSKQLKKSGTPTPTELSTYADASGLAFDQSGNLWAVVDTRYVVEFTAAQLKDLSSNPSPTPGVIITSTSVAVDFIGCNFDPQGNLWIADGDDDRIEEISKAQLAAGSNGDITFAAEIYATDFAFPAFITFDEAGNAWVASQGLSKLVELSASQLTSSGTKSPTVVISDDGSGTSLHLPGEIAFDKKGDLWVPNLISNTVVEYAKSQLSSTGNPAPTVKLSSKVFDGPFGVAFDSKGDLATMNYNNGTIAKFTAGQIKASGSPAPKAALRTDGTDNYQIIFGPPS
jgi:tripartite motif-containing protein 71